METSFSSILSQFSSTFSWSNIQNPWSTRTSQNPKNNRLEFQIPITFRIKTQENKSHHSTAPNTTTWLTKMDVFSISWTQQNKLLGFLLHVLGIQMVLKTTKWKNKLKDFWKKEIEELFHTILIDVVSIYTDCMSTKIGNWLQRNRKQNKLSNYTNKWYNYRYSNVEIPWFSPLNFSTWLYILITYVEKTATWTGGPGHGWPCEWLKGAILANQETGEWV